jgi:hypothetical protein
LHSLETLRIRNSHQCSVLRHSLCPGLEYETATSFPFFVTDYVQPGVVDLVAVVVVVVVVDLVVDLVVVLVVVVVVLVVVAVVVLVVVVLESFELCY